MNNCIINILSILSLYIPNASIQYKEKIAIYTCKYSEEYQIDYRWPISIMYMETRFRNFKTRNQTDDIGIMQLHCPTNSNSHYCTSCDVTKLQCNIKQGIKFLANIRNNCQLKHKHTPHWVRHYNWNSKYYGKKIIKFYKGL